MKRDKNLHPLSWEHHHALTSVVLTRRHISENAPHERLVRTAREFVGFHRDNLLPHFRHEEEVVLPLYLNHVPENTPEVLRLLTDHVVLHRLVGVVAEAADSGDGLIPALTELTDRLEAHVRFEERELFPKIEAALSADEIAQIGETLYAEPPGAVIIPGGDGCRINPTPQNADLEPD
jgi:hemerythrin-like domain-containing protein